MIDCGRDGIGLGDRHAEHHLCRTIGAVVLRGVEVGVVQFAPGQVVAQRHAVIGEVRIGVAEAIALQVAAARGFDRHAVAAAEEVVLRQLHRGGHAVGLRVAQAEHEAAGGGFLDVVYDVDLVVAAADGRGFDVHRLEVAQALQADLGTVDRGLRVPAVLELAHFATHHFVGGAGVATEQDAAHRHARARHDLHVDRHSLVGAVGGRDRVHLGERVADVGQRIGDGVRAELQQCTRERVAGLLDHHALDVLLREDGVAADLDLGDLVLRTLGHAGGEEHVALVGADRDLGRIDAEVDIAAVQVPGVELLQVAGQLFLGVLVVTAVPRRPVVLPGLPGLQDVLALELLGTDQVDVTDLGRLAFLDGDRDVHAVAVQRAHGRGDLDGVLATVVVLATQFLGHAVQAQAVEAVRT
ncbi:hypothetical protein G6F35_011255 [Rhizopus arrhizus]|nr:hypothetical protein G6F35_011255 [Rhizopus arrhizus]